MIRVTEFETPIGFARITATEQGIRKIAISSECSGSEKHSTPLLEKAETQLKEYFSGKRKEFDLPLDPEGTEFQKKVWQQLQSVPFSETRSYLSLARDLGDPNAIRAVAAANGKNPLWIVIPCHRIIGSDGSLTGYAGGLWRKKWLLDHENPVKQTRLF